MRTLAHLWTSSPAPLEYIELILCRDVYHCPPQHLPPWHICEEALAMMQVEAEVRKRRSRG